MNVRAPHLALALAACLPAACIIVVDENGSLSHGYLNHEDHGHLHETVRGSGVATSETRTVTDFEKIVVESSTNVVVKAGESTAVTVSGDDNLVSWVTVEVRDGALRIGNRAGSYSTRTPLVVTVSTPTLRVLASRGSGDVAVENLAGEGLEVRLEGSGNVDVSGKVTRVDASASGSGTLDLASLEARDVQAALAGSGDIDVWATGTLLVSLSGSGDVIYRGEAALTKAVSGSGDIVKR